MSGGEPSSIKRSTGCAASQPVLSKDDKDRVGAIFDFKVYGLVLQFGICHAMILHWPTVTMGVVAFLL